MRTHVGHETFNVWDPVAIAQVLSNLIRNAIVHGAVEPIAVSLEGVNVDAGARTAETSGPPPRT